jgi:anionic cell wall polymer biosynthesis LytR-Cps2A-Psr (LCP) family protein
MKVEASTNPDNKWGTERFTIGPGTVKLNGKQAEGFVRNRSYQAMGDPGRVNSQRKFYAAFMKEVLGMSTGEALTIAKNCYNDVNTDMTINQILGYIKAAQNLDLEKINMMAVPGQGGCYYGSQDCYSVLIGQYVELANKYMLPYSDPIERSDLKLVDISSGNGGNWMPGIGSLGEYSAEGS